MQFLKNLYFSQKFNQEQGVIIVGAADNRTPENIKNDAYTLGKLIASSKLNERQLYVVTGGGGGVMNAAARGSQEIGGHQVGVAHAAFAYQHNLNKGLYSEYYKVNTFGERLNILMKRGSQIVVFKGGVGTELEINYFALQMLINTTPYPFKKQVILFDHEGYYSEPNGFIHHLRYIVHKNNWPLEFMNLFKIVSTPEEALAFILDKSTSYTTGIKNWNKHNAHLIGGRND